MATIQTANIQRSFRWSILWIRKKYADPNSEEEESESDSKDNDIDKVLDETTDTRPKFGLLIDRMACEFLFDLLMLCYKRMSERKSLICQVIARQLSIQDNKEKSVCVTFNCDEVIFWLVSI